MAVHPVKMIRGVAGQAGRLLSFLRPLPLKLTDHAVGDSHPATVFYVPNQPPQINWILA
jgi:hypothetical protein